MTWRRVASAIALAVWLPGCNATFDVQSSLNDDELYAQLYPHYAELCAVSQIKKKPGFGADTSGGPGGHSVLYLNGVCRERDANYPTLTLCTANGDTGVGVSVNAHFKNANWIATDGRAFFFEGSLSPHDRLTHDAYARTQTEAKAKGLLDGVIFHQEVFDDMPPGMSREDYMYEVSVATDYAIAFGRDRYCARVPLTRAQMAKVVDYLNDMNAIYRSGKKDFEWNVLENNCTHLAHNALAAAGLWDDWETDRFILISAFDFPVPKNEFVNLIRRTNDAPIANRRDLYDDRAARRELMDDDRLPTGPGNLAEAEPVIQNNDIYETNLNLIFYDEPIFGAYERNFRAIFSEPRYTDIRANLRYFASLYETIKADQSRRKRTEVANGDRDFAAFSDRYDAYIARSSEAAKAQLAYIDNLSLRAGNPPSTENPR